MKTFLYIVEYRMNQCSDVEKVHVIAKDKWEAWDKARFEIIPEKNGCEPYNAWVHAIQYKNGNFRVINKSESMWV